MKKRRKKKAALPPAKKRKKAAPPPVKRKKRRVPASPKKRKEAAPPPVKRKRKRVVRLPKRTKAKKRTPVRRPLPKKKKPIKLATSKKRKPSPVKKQRKSVIAEIIKGWVSPWSKLPKRPKRTKPKPKPVKKTVFSRLQSAFRKVAFDEAKKSIAHLAAKHSSFRLTNLRFEGDKLFADSNDGRLFRFYVKTARGRDGEFHSRAIFIEAHTSQHLWKRPCLRTCIAMTTGLQRRILITQKWILSFPKTVFGIHLLDNNPSPPPPPPPLLP